MVPQHAGLEFGVGVNVFWHHWPAESYDRKDPHGNRDPEPARRALQVERAPSALDQLPPDQRDFYGRRIQHTQPHLQWRTQTPDRLDVGMGPSQIQTGAAASYRDIWSCRSPGFLVQKWKCFPARQKRSQKLLYCVTAHAGVLRCPTLL